MARLYLKFDNKTLKEFVLTQGRVSIGRLPDNVIQVDNPAVSGHHATIYWDVDHFVVEDNESFNGTYINDQRITRQGLRDGDNILIGKHTLNFKAEAHLAVAPASAAPMMPTVPSLAATVVLDTKKARELMAQAASAKAGMAAPRPAPIAAVAPAPVRPTVAEMRVGVLSVMSGKTDQTRYVLNAKLTVIGKSEMASIRLKGWFAPQVAAAITRRDEKYFIASSERKQKVKVNGYPITGQWELQAGDMISVAKVNLTFGYME